MGCCTTATFESCLVGSGTCQMPVMSSEGGCRRVDGLGVYSLAAGTSCIGHLVQLGPKSKAQEHTPFQRMSCPKSMARRMVSMSCTSCILTSPSRMWRATCWPSRLAFIRWISVLQHQPSLSIWSCCCTGRSLCRFARVSKSDRPRKGLLRRLLLCGNAQLQRRQQGLHLASRACNCMPTHSASSDSRKDQSSDRLTCFCLKLKYRKTSCEQAYFIQRQTQSKSSSP